MSETFAEFSVSVAGTASAWPISSLVPHEKPMSLLDEVISVTESALMAQVTIHQDSIFAEPQGVPVLVGIEYMAQAIAAFAGHRALTAGGSIKLGFLVGTRRLVSNSAFFPVGSRLLIRVTQLLNGDNGLSVFECVIRSENIEVSANLNVFQPSNPEEFLAQA